MTLIPWMTYCRGENTMIHYQETNISLMRNSKTMATKDCTTLEMRVRPIMDTKRNKGSLGLPKEMAAPNFSLSFAQRNLDHSSFFFSTHALLTPNSASPSFCSKWPTEKCTSFQPSFFLFFSHPTNLLHMAFYSWIMGGGSMVVSFCVLQGWTCELALLQGLQSRQSCMGKAMPVRGAREKRNVLAYCIGGPREGWKREKKQ